MCFGASLTIQGLHRQTTNVTYQRRILSAAYLVLDERAWRMRMTSPRGYRRYRLPYAFNVVDSDGNLHSSSCDSPGWNYGLYRTVEENLNSGPLVGRTWNHLMPRPRRLRYQFQCLDKYNQQDVPLTVGKKCLDPFHELLAVHYIDNHVCQRNTVPIDIANGEEIGRNLAVGLQQQYFDFLSLHDPIRVILDRRGLISCRSKATGVWNGLELCKHAFVIEELVENLSRTPGRFLC
jgi:hypothetical protein